MANNFFGLSFICGFDGIILGFRITYVNDIECGTTDFTRKLILKGNRTQRGEFTFLAALHLVEHRKFICVGSLISEKHVLTAVHCTKYQGIILLPVDLIVLLRSYDLTSRTERGGVQRDVAEIRIHPDWKMYNEELDVDIAILVLKWIVAFTNFIRPVCLPADDSILNGTTSHLTYPQHVVTNALNDSYCYTTDYVAANISSLRTFCGGGEAISPNQGGFGVGFCVRHGLSWAQYGVISALRSNGTGYVDEHSIALFTNVTALKTSIKDTVELSGGEVGEAIGINKFKLQLNCSYVTGRSYRHTYGCFVHNLDIRSKNVAVTSFTGFYKDGKTDEDVEMLQFENGTMFYVSDGIGNNFKNLKILNTYFDGPTLNTKLIRRSSFKNLNSFEELEIRENDIVTLEEDSLWDLPHLREFVLDKNKIESIPVNLFKNNLMLKIAHLDRNRIKAINEETFSNNPNLNRISFASNQLESIPKNVFKNNFLLETEIFVNNPNLQGVALSENQLESIPANLFKNNLQLTDIEIKNNRIKTIDVDFSVFQNLQSIDLRNNLCIDDRYEIDYDK